MQVILQSDVPDLGDAGSIVTVRDGYARNFLIPKKLAVKADPKNVKMLEHQKRVVAAKQAKRKGDAEQIGEKVRAAVLTFQRDAGEEGKLFGSVTTSDIASALAEQGVVVDRRHIKTDPIKMVGDFEAEVRLHADVKVPVKITVEATKHD